MLDEDEKEIVDLCSRQKKIVEDLREQYETFKNAPVASKTESFLKDLLDRIEVLWEEFKENHTNILISPFCDSNYDSDLVDDLVDLKDNFKKAIEDFQLHGDAILQMETEDDTVKFDNFYKDQKQISEKINEHFDEFIENSSKITINQLAATKEKLEDLWNKFAANHSAIAVLKVPENREYEDVLVNNVVDLKDKFTGAIQEKELENETIDNDSVSTDIETSNLFSRKEVMVVTPESEIVRMKTPELSESPKPQFDSDTPEPSILSSSLPSNQTLPNNEQSAKFCSSLKKFLSNHKMCCRICLKSSTSNLNEIQKPHRFKSTIAELIEFCTGLNCLSEPHLSQLICSDCLKRFEDCYEIKILTAESTETLRKEFQEVMKQIEEVPEDEIVDESVDDSDSLLVEISPSVQSAPTKSRKRGRSSDNRSNSEQSEVITNNVKCPYCSSSFPNIKSVFLHLEEHKKNGVWTCHLCDFSSQSYYNTYYHFKKLHPYKSSNASVKKPLSSRRKSTAMIESSAEKEISSVKKSFKRSRAISIDISPKARQIGIGKGNGVPFDCPICKKVLSTKSKSINHLSKEHSSENGFSCKLCDFITHSGSKFYYHTRGHYDNYQAKCSICSEVFCDKLATYRHSFKKHQGQNATFIEMKLPSNAKVKEASNDKTNPGTSQKNFCFMCETHVNSLKEMYTHLEENHKKNNEFKCVNCKEFTSTSSFLYFNHLKDCCKACKACGKRFADKRLLKYHLKTHKKSNDETTKAHKKSNDETTKAHKKSNDETTKAHRKSNDKNASTSGETRYPCKYCDKTFSYFHNIGRHIQVFHPEKFSKSPAMNDRSKIIKKIIKKATNVQRGSKQAIKTKCFYCNKEEPSLSKLFKHLDDVHKGNGKFSCVFPDCNYTVINSKTLYYHNQQHLVKIKQEKEK